MENKLYLYGASGHCKVVIDILQSNNVDITAVIDDNPKAEELLNIPVIYSESFEVKEQQSFIISIGDNATRKRIVDKMDCKWHTAIHPKVILSKYCKIGKGTVVMAGAIINADAVIGAHCIINTAAVVEHDCVIEDYVHVSPNVSLAGGVQVGEGAHIGIGATVIQGVRIGKWATIGAGTTVIADVPDYAVVVGTPGKVIKYKKTS